MKRVVVWLVFGAFLLTACAPDGETNAGSAPAGTLVVLGFAPGDLEGQCRLGIGPSGKRKISVQLDVGWGLNDGATTYHTARLKPGEWDVFQIACGNFAIDRRFGPPGYTARSQSYRALAHFSIDAASTVYLGNIVLQNAGDASWQRFGMALDRPAAELHLRETGHRMSGPLELSPFRHSDLEVARLINRRSGQGLINLSSGWRSHPRRGHFGGRLSGAPPAILFPNRSRRLRALSEHIPSP